MCLCVSLSLSVCVCLLSAVVSAVALHWFLCRLPCVCVCVCVCVYCVYFIDRIGDASVNKGALPRDRQLVPNLCGSSPHTKPPCAHSSSSFLCFGRGCKGTGTARTRSRRVLEHRPQMAHMTHLMAHMAGVAHMAHMAHVAPMAELDPPHGTNCTHGPNGTPCSLCTHGTLGAHGRRFRLLWFRVGHGCGGGSWCVR